jgi:hypothetical protein
MVALGGMITVIGFWSIEPKSSAGRLVGSGRLEEAFACGGMVIK